MEKDRVLINQHSRKHYPIKTTKKQLLIYIKQKRIIIAMDLVEHFGYKLSGAKRRLYTLAEEDLLTSWLTPGQFCLTQQGERKVKYYAKKENAED